MKKIFLFIIIGLILFVNLASASIVEEAPDNATACDSTQCPEDVTSEVSLDDSVSTSIGIPPIGSAYMNMTWLNSIPSGSVINSVIFKVEHATTGKTTDFVLKWLNGSELIEVCDLTESATTITDSCNLSSYIDTIDKANNLSLQYFGTTTAGAGTGLVDWAQINITYTPPDSNPPNITLISPSNGSILDSYLITFEYNVTDTDSGVASCKLTINETVNQTDSSITEGITQTFTIEIEDGNYTWSVNCTDDSENANEGSSATWNLEIPIVKIALSSEAVSQNVTLDIQGYGLTANENATINITLNETSVEGYPKTKTADSKGAVNDSWIVPLNASWANYTITIYDIITGNQKQEIFEVKQAYLINGTLQDSGAVTIDGSTGVYEEEELFDYDDEEYNFTFKYGKNYDFEATPTLKKIKKAMIKKIKNAGPTEDVLIMEDPAETGNWTEIVSWNVNTSDFDVAGITFNHSYGKDFGVYKCTNWNWASQTCTGGWLKVADVCDGFCPAGEVTIYGHGSDPGGGVGPDPYYIEPPDYANITDIDDTSTNVTSNVSADDITYAEIDTTEDYVSNGTIQMNWSVNDSMETVLAANVSLVWLREYKTPRDKVGTTYADFYWLNGTTWQAISNCQDATVPIATTAGPPDAEFVRYTCNISSIIDDPSKVNLTIYVEFSSKKQGGGGDTAIVYVDYAEYSLQYLSPDVTPPNITLISPGNGSTANSPVLFEYNVTDDQSGISFCELIIDGTVYQTNGSITEGVTQNFTQELLAGDYTWSVNCTDGSLNANEGASDTWDLTVALPIYVTNPPSNAIKCDNEYCPLDVSLLVLEDDNITATINISGIFSAYMNITWATYIAPGSTINSVSVDIEHWTNGSGENFTLWWYNVTNASFAYVCDLDDSSTSHIDTCNLSSFVTTIDDASFVRLQYRGTTAGVASYVDWANLNLDYTLYPDLQPPNVTNLTAIPDYLEQYVDLTNISAIITDNIALDITIAEIAYPNGTIENYTMDNPGKISYHTNIPSSTESIMGSDYAKVDFENVTQNASSYRTCAYVQKTALRTGNLNFWTCNDYSSGVPNVTQGCYWTGASATTIDDPYISWRCVSIPKFMIESSNVSIVLTCPTCNTTLPVSQNISYVDGTYEGTFHLVGHQNYLRTRFNVSDPNISDITVHTNLKKYGFVGNGAQLKIWILNETEMTTWDGRSGATCSYHANDISATEYQPVTCSDGGAHTVNGTHYVVLHLTGAKPGAYLELRTDIPHSNTTQFSSDGDIWEDMLEDADLIVEYTSGGVDFGNWELYMSYSNLTTNHSYYSNDSGANWSVADDDFNNTAEYWIDFYGFVNITNLFYEFINTNETGWYNVTIYANDTSGNVNNTERVSFFVFAPTNLSIWDETDNTTKYRYDNVYFWANYTHRYSGQPVPNANCNISFDLWGWTAWQPMTYNSTSKLFEYNRSFDQVGMFDWNVTCWKTGFQTNSATDNFTIYAIGPYVYTNRARYKFCPIVYYKIWAYDVNDILLDTNLTITIYDTNNAVKTSFNTQTGNGGTGIYIGNYTLSATASLGAWLIKAVAYTVKATKVFFVGTADTNWKINISFSPDSIVYDEGTNITMKFIVWDKDGEMASGLLPGNLSVFIDTTNVTSSVTEVNRSYYYNYTSTVGSHIVDVSSRDVRNTRGFTVR